MAYATRMLGAIATVLLGVIAAELAIGSSTEQAASDTAPQPMAPLPSPSHARPEHRDQSAAWMTAALARPLFTPGRRPPSPDAEPVPPLASPPRLTGTLVSPDSRRAMFAAGDKTVVLEERSKIGTWTVQAITAGSVTLAGPGGPHVLRVSLVPDGPAQAIQVVQLTGVDRPARTHSRTEVASSK